MIYETPEPFSPIQQGDIFIRIPIVDLPAEELPIIKEDESAQIITWEDFALVEQIVSAVIAVRPTIGIVATQECDALRAPNITLFEVRPFRDIERKSKDTSKPSKWVPIITQHARVNQKWFYLPADAELGFIEKMGADFLTPIRVPRDTLERLIGFRVGRLKEVAKQHFRERVSEFFRRYAYDEWYPLTLEEFTEYKKNYPDAEAFSWQREATGASEQSHRVEEVHNEQLAEKGLIDYRIGAEKAFEELNSVLILIQQENGIVTEKIKKHSEDIAKINSSSTSNQTEKLDMVCRRTAGDILQFSRKIEIINLYFAATIKQLDENLSGYIELVSPDMEETIEELNVFRGQINALSREAKSAHGGFCSYRDSTNTLGKQQIHAALTYAARKQTAALNGVVLNIESVESFCLRTLFQLDEKFGGEKSSKE